MKKLGISITVFVVLGFVLSGFLSGPRAETLSSYQESAQREFLREAANPRHFKKAVQTARLLGYLEFLEPKAFTGFHQCMETEKRWSYLSAKRRESLLNSCRAKGRAISAIETSDIASPGVRPAKEKRQEQTIQQLRSEIVEMRSALDNMTRMMREHQNRVTDALTAIRRDISSVPAESTRRPESSPQEFENY